jgi:tetratricopeptide (TPR) repeat protein
MKRPDILAIVLLATLPTIGRAQTAKEFADIHVKLSQSRPLSGNGMGDLRAYSESLTGSHFGDWSVYNRAGWRAIDKGYYDTAEHEFSSAIKAAKLAGKGDLRLVARSYADYAWALQKQGRNAEAEPHAKWALIAREALLDKGAPAIAQSRNQLATLYYDLGRPADAEPLLRLSIESQANSPRANPQELARSETLMGLLLASQRRFAESERHFVRAITLREKALSSSSADLGDALNNLAWAYHEQGKDDQARPLFERALRYLERARGESAYSVAHVLDGLGQILAKEGKTDQAETDFLRAIAVWEQFPNEGLSLLGVLRHYADLLEDKGRSDDLSKLKDRIAPLRAKYSFGREALGRWYRFPDPPTGLGANPPGTATPAPLPGTPG